VRATTVSILALLFSVQAATIFILIVIFLHFQSTDSSLVLVSMVSWIRTLLPLQQQQQQAVIDRIFGRALEIRPIYVGPAHL